MIIIRASVIISHVYRHIATAGTLIGAKVGLFHVNPNISENSGFYDFNWFHFN